MPEAISPMKRGLKIIKSLQEELEMIKRQVELLRERNKELERLATTDELTGLYNQRYFHDKLEQEVTNRKQKHQDHSLCLIFFDVDDLKKYNDTCGHLGGNDVLKAVARSLSQSIEKSVGSGYRYGGDEFAVILPEVHVEEAVKIARKINEDLRKMGFRDVTLSFGVAELGPGMDSATLFRHADSAMYMAKKSNLADKIYIFSGEEGC